MCGITGIIGKHVLSEEILNRISLATNSLKHRGPNNSETTIGNSWALGHTRLSVIDPSPDANQPMQSSDGNLIIVFNGEIYNHLSIRSELQANGVAFKTNSDTETLLEAFAFYGKDVLLKLNGFFTFCIYNKKQNEFFLARDRYGIKPLLIGIHDDFISFGSEMKAVMSFPVSKELDFETLGTYLQYSYIPAPRSIYKNVSKILPGQMLTITNTRTLIFEFYYEIKTRQSSANLNFQNAARTVKELTFNSVQKRLISDVPLGCFLSGGVDSSIIAWCANQVKPTDTFSIGFKNHPFFDESSYAKQVAKHIGTKHYEIEISDDDLLDSLTSVEQNMDEPFADSSAIAVNALAKFTQEHVTVALSGDGADELFSGYNKHEALFKSMGTSFSNSLIKITSPIHSLFNGSRETATANFIRKAQKYQQGLRLNLTDRYGLWAKFTSIEQAEKLLQNFREIPLNELIHNIEDFNDILLNDFNLVLQNDMLHKVDRMSMSHGLEVRTPFLDHHLVDFVFSLDSNFKINNKGKKRLLKEAFKQEIPSNILSRKKHGFEVPLVSWFQGPLQTKLQKYVLNKNLIQEQGIFSFDEINNLFASGLSTNRDTIWALLQFQIWYFNR